MRTFFILVLLSIIGIGITAGSVYYGDMKRSGESVAIASMQLPFKNFIAGEGIVEPESKNIFIGSQISGVVAKVYVNSGERVKQGDLLFKLDDAVQKAHIALLRVQVKAAKIALKTAKEAFEIIKKKQKISSMVTKEKYAKTLGNYNKAKADLAVAKQKLRSAEELLKLYTIYSPIDGTVLRSDITPGSLFDVNTKALVIGSDNYNIRVNINAFDSWKFEKNKSAVAYVRGNPKQKVSLQYKYTIPFVIPKKNLTGTSTEQTDTRVLQVVYGIEQKPDFLLYVGEMLDVFIETSKGK